MTDSNLKRCGICRRHIGYRSPRDTFNALGFRIEKAAMGSNRNQPNHARHNTSPDRGSLNRDLGKLSVLADWRHIPFLMVDSPQTKLLEDAVAARGSLKDKEWSADLKVVHPLPLDGPVSLKEREDQVCLGIRDYIGDKGERSPSVSLVLANNLTRISDRQAHAILENRERSVSGIGGGNCTDPSLVSRLKSQLQAVRATALQISFWKDRPLTPEHVMAILSTHAQSATIQASRKLPSCPSLIVLRHQDARSVSDREWKERGVPYATKSGLSVVAVGKAVPTLLRQGESAHSLDSLRLKERAVSGSINVTQIACSLLGITPIPEELVRHGIRSDSESDVCKRGGPFPEVLAAVMHEKRNAIREVLRSLTHLVHMPGNERR